MSQHSSYAGNRGMNRIRNVYKDSTWLVNSEVYHVAQLVRALPWEGEVGGSSPPVVSNAVSPNA